MNISVIGAGSIGSLFAGRMAHSGFEVDVVGRKPHVSKIQEKGLFIKSRKEEINSFFPAYEKLNPSQFHSDALFITTKAYDNKVIAKLLSNRIKKDIPLFLIQNGMGNERIFREMLPENPIYRAITTEAAEVVFPGTIKHVAFGKTSFGTIMGNGNGFGTRVKDILSSSGFKVKETNDIHIRMWYKLLANAAICPLGAILHVKNGEIIQRPSFKRIFDTIIEEGIALANIYLPDEDFSQTRDFILNIIEKTSENKCSMLQDIERGRRTEINFLNGFIARESRKKGLKAPINAIITDLVRYIEQKP